MVNPPEPIFPPDKHVESESTPLPGGDQRNILRLIVRTVVQTTGDGDVEFARKVRIFRIAIAADKNPIELLNDVRSVERLIRCEPSQSAPINVANVVDARLQRPQVHSAQLFPDFRDALKRESAKLDLLPRGDVQHVVSEPTRKIANSAKLRAGGEAVGHAHPHHELPRRRPAEENTHPLQQFLLSGRERGRASFDDLRQVFENPQTVAILRGLIAFYRVGDRFGVNFRRFFVFETGGTAEQGWLQDCLRGRCKPRNHARGTCSALAPSSALRIQLVLERLWLAARPTADRAFCKLQKVPASFLRGKRDRKKGKRR